MNSQFSHDVVCSFHLWFEKKLLDEGCYQTGLSNNFTPVWLPGLDTGYICYQGEYRQLVAENSISVPNSGFFANGAFITGDHAQSSIYTDYSNGRLIVPTLSGSGITFTANSSVKEVNVYPASDNLENSLVYGDFLENGQTNSYLFNQTGTLNENTYILPCCLLEMTTNSNQEFCFGGEEESLTNIRVMAVTQDKFTLDGILSIFSDTERESIVHVPYSSYPYSTYGDVSSYPYEYDSVATGSISSLIKKVSVARVDQSLSDNLFGKNLKLGILDFTLSTLRYPRL